MSRLGKWTCRQLGAADGKPLAEGRDVATHADAGSGVALVRLLGRITPTAKVEIAAK